ncbi:unnamed protein product [Arctogadus glacialis]
MLCLMALLLLVSPLASSLVSSLVSPLASSLVSPLVSPPQDSGCGPLEAAVPWRLWSPGGRGPLEAVVPWRPRPPGGCGPLEAAAPWRLWSWRPRSPGGRGPLEAVVLEAVVLEAVVLEAVVLEAAVPWRPWSWRPWSWRPRSPGGCGPGGRGPLEAVVPWRPWSPGGRGPLEAAAPRPLEAVVPWRPRPPGGCGPLEAAAPWRLWSWRLWSPGGRGPGGRGRAWELECENDYLHTISCSLRAPPPGQRPPNGSSWLNFSIKYDDESEMGTGRCPLTHRENRSSCLFQNPNGTLGWTPFQIHLCHEPCPTAPCCEELEDYYPQEHITPIAPSQLAVVLNASRLLFSWLSSYEAYLPNFFLLDHLQYQLRLQRVDQHQAVRTAVCWDLPTDAQSSWGPWQNHVTSWGPWQNHVTPGISWGPWQNHPVTLSGMGRSLAVDVESLAAGGQYTARVRSSPAEGGGRDLGLVVAVCLLTPVLLLASVTLLRMRKRTFIPTPVLRFSPLTEHRQSLAVPLPPDTAPSAPPGAPMETECAALISVLRAPVDVPVDAWAGAPGPDGKGALESGPEEDSGCCHCSPRSEDGGRGGGGYRNAYCTLSDPPEPPDPQSPPDPQGDGERGRGGYRNAYCTLSDPQDPPDPPKAPGWITATQKAPSGEPREPGLLLPLEGPPPPPPTRGSSSSH